MFVIALRSKTVMFFSLMIIACLTGMNIAHASQPQDQQPQTSLLKVGDKINILVEGENDLSGFYTISKAGKIEMPLIGEIFVAGKTAHEAKTLITQKLQDGYLHHPDVLVKEKPQTGRKKITEEIPEKTVEDSAPSQKTLKRTYQESEPTTKENTKHIYIVGAIKNPGYYTLPPEAGHILNIIALAGGYTNKANTDSFEIVRNIDGKYYRKQAQTGALEYHDGDIVIIEKR